MEKINELQKEIVLQALDWLYKKAPETTWEEIGKNRGAMLNELKKTFGFKTGIEAWCAMFGWGIVNEASKVVNAKNYLPKTAGALDLLKKSQKSNRIIVKNEPDIGAVMYRKSGDPSATGHIGVVVKIEPDGKFWTIEGNVGERVGMVSYVPKKDTEPRYYVNGGQVYFMWAGRQEYTGKARNESIDIIQKKVNDTTKTKYVVITPNSEIEKPEKIKSKKYKRGAWN